MKQIFKKLLSALSLRRFVFARLPRRRNEIALTFDDGPHPEQTEKILRVLKDAAVPATFFLSGSAAEKYPVLVSDIIAHGHEVANHGFSHSRIAEIGWQTYRTGIDKTEQLLSKCHEGKRHRLFRPPYGECNLRLLWFMLWHGYRYVGWSADSRDSFIREAAELRSTVQSLRIKPGDILLFHDDYLTTVNALPEILRDLKDQGYRFVRISELLELPA